MDWNQCPEWIGMGVRNGSEWVSGMDRNTHFNFTIFYSNMIFIGMPTDKPKIIFVADKDLLERLDDFRFQNRINSRSEAISVS